MMFLNEIKITLVSFIFKLEFNVLFINLLPAQQDKSYNYTARMCTITFNFISGV